MVNANGSGIREVTDEFAQFVDWSPDGQYLVFSPGLNIIRPDGSGLTSLKVGSLSQSFPIGSKRHLDGPRQAPDCRHKRRTTRLALRDGHLDQMECQLAGISSSTRCRDL
jgi:hypothetical protein